MPSVVDLFALEVMIDAPDGCLSLVSSAIRGLMDVASAPGRSNRSLALPDKEYQGYMIAKSHLGSSFDLEKSLGFIDWKQKPELLKPQQKNS